MRSLSPLFAARMALRECETFFFGAASKMPFHEVDASSTAGIARGIMPAGASARAPSCGLYPNKLSSVRCQTVPRVSLSRNALGRTETTSRVYFSANKDEVTVLNLSSCTSERTIMTQTGKSSTRSRPRCRDDRWDEDEAMMTKITQQLEHTPQLHGLTT